MCFFGREARKQLARVSTKVVGCLLPRLVGWTRDLTKTDQNDKRRHSRKAQGTRHLPLTSDKPFTQYCRVLSWIFYVQLRKRLPRNRSFLSCGLFLPGYKRGIYRGKNEAKFVGITEGATSSEVKSTIEDIECPVQQSQY